MTRYDKFKFDVLSRHFLSCGLSQRETVFLLCSNVHICPLDADIKVFRDFESKGILPPNYDIDNNPLKQGKAQVESIGELCSNYIRRSSYWGNPKYPLLECWEGTEYWDQYPDWFTKILLWWHPKYNPK